MDIAQVASRKNSCTGAVLMLFSVALDALLRRRLDGRREADEAVCGVKSIACGILIAGLFLIFRGKRSKKASAKNDTPE